MNRITLCSTLFLVLFFFFSMTTYLMMESHFHAITNKYEFMVSHSRSHLTPSVLPFRSGKTTKVVISILTVERPSREDYLRKTLKSIWDQLKDISIESVEKFPVFVFHPRAEGSHTVFSQCKQDFQYFDFVEQDVLMKKSLKNHHQWKGIWGGVKKRDVQQTLDFQTMLKNVRKRYQCEKEDDTMVLVMEDDFEWCPFFLNHLDRVLTGGKLYFGNFTSIRISYGLNGILLHCRDLEAIEQYLQEMMLLGPADALLGSFITGSNQQGKKYFGNNRHYAIYRHNLLDHIGLVSTIRTSSDRTTYAFPRCFDLIKGGINQEEYFNFGKCQNKEFSPCDDQRISQSVLMIRANSEFDQDFQMHQAPAHIQIMIAKVNEDCESACKTIKAKCARYMFPLINHCHVLKKYFPCHHCEDHPFYFPFEYGRNPEHSIIDTNVCYFSPIMKEMTCERSSPNTQRLCPCES